MRKLNWQELTSWYNKVFNTNYKHPSTMLRNAYRKSKEWNQVALKLGISYEMIRQYRKEHPEIDKGYNK